MSGKTATATTPLERILKQTWVVEGTFVMAVRGIPGANPDGDNLEEVCEVLHFADKDEEAAREGEISARLSLISAAPEMLAALKRMPQECPMITHHRPDCDWCAIHRAIAKAEGRTL